MRLLLILSAALLAGCSFIEKPPPKPMAARADTSFEINAPQVMRGTVAAEAVLLGYRPTIVRGYGLVVGLNGTGSSDLPPTLRGHMLAEMARRGIGQESSGFGHLKPDAMLDSQDTAVVIVEGVVPAGAVGRDSRRGVLYEGSRFDIRVFAHPFTSTTSLEGGRLYTAELRPAQPGERLPPTGSRQAAAIAEASGPIFVNPFAEPGSDRVNRTIGRILGGGQATQDLPIKLRLAQPSHTRAEVMQNAINTRFPREPGQTDPTARGESDESVVITVPPTYRDRTDEFVELLRHSSVRQAAPEMVAQFVKRTLTRDPTAANSAAWRWEALGPRALSVTKTMYDYPEELPRLAALRAGAQLDDPLVIPHLIEMTDSDTGDVRRQAVELLGRMKIDPRIDQAVRALLSDPDIDVRLAAYEAQTRRRDPGMTRHPIDDKFVLDVIDSDYPMVYVAQIGQPRIALFGRDLALERPLLVDAWSGRLLLKGEEDVEEVEVYYRTADGGGRTIQRTSARMEDFIQFLGHRPTVDAPEPGLGLSYAETVGAVFQIWRQESLKADFKSEQDRVLAAIQREQETSQIEARPEFSDPDFDFLRPEDGEATAPPGAEVARGLEEIPAAPPIGQSTGDGAAGDR